MREDQILARYRAALVNGLGNLIGVLASAAPEDKAEVYRRLRLQLTYDPARRVVTVESHLGPDGNSPLPRGLRPSGGPTSGAPAAVNGHEKVPDFGHGKSQLVAMRSP